MTIQIPDGQMCTGCIHKHRKCDHLPFHTMQKIAKPDNDDYEIVRCTDYEKLENEEDSRINQNTL